MRTVDTVARFGGDEFVLLITSIQDPEDAKHLAARAIEVLQAPVRIAGIQVGKVTSVDLQGDHVDVTFKIKTSSPFGTLL